MIALDATSSGTDVSGTATSLTFSHTCTGSNLILFVSVGTEPASDKVTGVTYNGVAMIRVNIATANGTQPVASYLYYLIAPATGAHNVVISVPGNSTNIHADSVSYTGAKQTGQPDASGTGTATSGTIVTTNITVVATGCWVVSSFWNLNVRTVGTGVTSLRGSNTMLGDSNGTVATGTQSQTWNTDTSGSSMAMVMASFAPAPVSSGFFPFMQ